MSGTVTAPATDSAGNALVTYASFVLAFPEFGNTTLYPAAQIEFWLSLAYSQLNAFRFGTQLPLAVMLFIAHNIVLSARETQAGTSGQIVGSVQGPMSSKSVGPLSVSYAGTTGIEGGGAWNYTSYGQRLYTMMRAFAAGPKYVPGPRAYSFRGYGYGYR
ncbi:MAG: DUF4054 domain-containing protein [Janthinobacterium lividum]